MAKVKVECAACGRTFETTKYKAQRNQRHFCCRACLYEFGRTQATCPQCRRTFDTQSSKAQEYHNHFCSAECQAFYRQSNNARSQRQCEYCGKAFEARSQPTAQLPYRFCSHECHSASQTNRVEKACPVCGKSISATPSDIARGKNVYCSNQCRLKGKERTSIEKAVAAILDRLNVKYSEQHAMGRYTCDFFLESASLVIEADGAYHHKLPKCQQSDARKDAHILAKGYKVLRLRADDRNRLPLSAEQQILDFIKMPGSHEQLHLLTP